MHANESGHGCTEAVHPSGGPANTGSASNIHVYLRSSAADCFFQDQSPGPLRLRACGATPVLSQSKGSARTGNLNRLLILVYLPRWPGPFTHWLGARPRTAGFASPGRRARAPLFGTQDQVTLPTSGIQDAGFNGGLNGAARFALVAAIVELAVPEQRT